MINHLCIGNKGPVRAEDPLPVQIPQLALESARSAFQTSRIETKPAGSNVALICVTPRDGEIAKPQHKQLKKQDLPSLSINPTSARADLGNGAFC